MSLARMASISRALRMRSLITSLLLENSLLSTCARSHSSLGDVKEILCLDISWPPETGGVNMHQLCTGVDSCQCWVAAKDSPLKSVPTIDRIPVIRAMQDVGFP